MALSILIVDDSPAMRSFIRRIIEVSGLDPAEFHEAGDGECALALLRQTSIDVMVTDINMPRMNGEQLVHEMEDDEKLRSVPVVVVSTDSTDTRIHRMMALGARGYVRKPFAPETIRGELERVLGVSRG